MNNTIVEWLKSHIVHTETDGEVTRTVIETDGDLLTAIKEIPDDITVVMQGMKILRENR